MEGKIEVSMMFEIQGPEALQGQEIPGFSIRTLPSAKWDRARCPGELAFYVR